MKYIIEDFRYIQKCLLDGYGGEARERQAILERDVKEDEELSDEQKQYILNESNELSKSMAKRDYQQSANVVGYILDKIIKVI